MKFEVYGNKNKNKKENGGYRWRLVAGSGQVVARSAEEYVDKAHARRNAEVVAGVIKENAGKAEIVEV
jgi:uncharacterized protein YegP (UPF0339 family)